MISRRNIRVKVMQSLYALASLANEVSPGEPLKLLQKHFDQTRQLFVYLTYFLTEVARYSETNAHLRASKHLITAEDLNVNTKIAGNEVMWKILEESSFKELLKKEKPEHSLDKELLRKIYLDLEQTPEYKTYISSPERNKAVEKGILEYIFNTHMLQNEIFISHIEDLFSNWYDDAEMIIQLIMAYMQKPASYNLNQMIGQEKMRFGKDLLSTVLEKEEHLLTYIVPKLKNWDPERIAQLDMILMKMGVTEFLYFETIPPKVTINEYIDLAKEYSTNQSGHFVNGILDSIHKDLLKEGIMKKIDFKKN